MNERLPYEEQLAQQISGLPLPDENMAWEDMKRRLEEDDDDSIIPIWLRGCGLWGLVAIILLAIGWWFIRPDKWRNKKQEKETVATTPGKNSDDINKTTTDTTSFTKSHQRATVHKMITDSIAAPREINRHSRKQTRMQQQPGPNSDFDSGVAGRKGSIDKNRIVKPVVSNDKKTKKTTKHQTTRQNINVPAQLPGRENDQPNRVVTSKDATMPVVKDSAIAMKVPTITTDSIGHPNASDSTARNDSTVRPNNTKKDSSKSKAISFGAGLGMHQLIPIAGQALTPYSASGRTGSLADYIPSAYVRMYKGNKWFLQLEFRYGAPQSAGQILYAQTSRIDTIGGVHYTTTESYRLKKTFYHQLPLTFDYFLTKDWSVGGGIVWNKFYSAVSEQTTNMKNNTTQIDSVISKGIVSTLDDTATTSSGAVARSAFHASYFQGLIETQYRWKRLSIGLKYSFGLQPYVETKVAGQPSQQERNMNLQLFLRYELWKSKARRLKE